jgi:hypothetical protein
MAPVATLRAVEGAACEMTLDESYIAPVKERRANLHDIYERTTKGEI